MSSSSSLTIWDTVMLVRASCLLVQSPFTSTGSDRSVGVDLVRGSVGCFGGEIETPNLDRIAAEGIRFTDCKADHGSKRAGTRFRRRFQC